MSYWGDRCAAAQKNLLSKNTKQIQRKLEKSYVISTRKILGQFVKTYDKVISGIDEGVKPTPADLYRLDTYWKMQGQLQQELHKLGNKQLDILQNSFINHFEAAYEDMALIDNRGFFNGIDTKAA